MTLDAFNTNGSSPPERAPDQVADEESLRRERGAALGRWMHEQRQRRSSARPRDCCLVSPETAHEHGHPLDDTDLAGADDALAQAAFERRSRWKDNASG
jgi:hypothetical protein